MGKVDGKVAVVTGGTSGTGLAEGAHVFITGRRQVERDAAVKLIGSRATGVQGDVANLADLDRLYAAVKEQKGRRARRPSASTARPRRRSAPSRAGSRWT